MILEVFDARELSWIIKGEGRLFLRHRKNRLAITQDVLERTTRKESRIIDELNIDKASKVTCAGFMRLEEIAYAYAYAKAKVKAKKAFSTETGLTRLDISVDEERQHATLCLKRSIYRGANRPLKGLDTSKSSSCWILGHRTHRCSGSRLVLLKFSRYNIVGILHARDTFLEKEQPTSLEHWQ